MDRLTLMSVFVAVAQAGSFSAAARELGISAPAVTRAVAALEGRLGVKLLTRTTRHVRLTEVGRRYLEDARRAIALCDEADQTAAGVSRTPHGQIVVTAPVLFGRIYVMPAIVSYLRKYDQTDVSALFVDRVVQLVEEGLDVGIRIGELALSSLIAIRVGRVHRVTCAAPAYLRRHGTPVVPSQLREHTTINANAVSSATEWKFRQGQETTAVRVKPRVRVTTNDAAIEAVIAGFGIARLLSYQVAPYVASGEIQLVLREYEGEALPVHVVHREDRHGSAKVRTFVDHMVEHLRANPALR
jgi:DNA-binding transcriptional LysR family regulator